MQSLLQQWLPHIWMYSMGPAFGEGLLYNEASLQMDFLREVRESADLSSLHAWVRPAFHFPQNEGPLFDHLDVFKTRRQLTGNFPGLVMTHEDQVVAAGILRFIPQGYLDYHPDIKFLSSLYRLRGKDSWLLGYQDRSQDYLISPDLVFFYGVVTRSSALALQLSALRKEVMPQDFPAPFLHLKGSVRTHRSDFSFESV
ncbi:MAG: hypothetical protein AAF804_11905, partial [Bacteroidota bacterium]